MQPFLTNRVGNYYTVINSQKILCHNASRSEATVAIATMMPWLSLPQLEALLDADCDPALWRSTWASAVSSSLGELQSDLQNLPTSEVTNDLASRLEELHAIVTAESERISELHAKQQSEIERQQALEAKKQLLYRSKKRAAEIVNEIVTAVRPKGEFYDNLGGKFLRFADSRHYAECYLATTPLGKQIAQLEREVEGL